MSRRSSRRNVVDTSQNMLSMFKTRKTRQPVVQHKAGFKVFDDSKDSFGEKQNVRDAIEERKCPERQTCSSRSKSMPPIRSQIRLPAQAQADELSVPSTPTKQCEVSGVLQDSSLQLTPSKRKQRISNESVTTQTPCESTPVQRRILVAPKSTGSKSTQRRLFSIGKEEVVGEKTKPSFKVPDEPERLRNVSSRAASLAKSAAAASSGRISKFRALLESPKKTEPAQLQSKATEEWKEDSRALLNKESRCLLLPLKYQRLIDIFEALETSMSVLIARNKQSVLYKDVREAVEKTCKRSFTRERLGQILFLVPEAYSVGLREERSSTGALKQFLSITFKELSSDSDEKVPISRRSWERKNFFRSRILNIVHDHHEAFLKTLPNPPQMDRQTMRAWHIDFELEKLPDLRQAVLPKQDVKTSHERIAMITAVDKKTKANATPTLSSPAEAKVSKELQRVPSSLLDKIRAKEAARREFEDNVGSAEEIQRRKLVQDLPQLMALIRTLFVSSRRSVMKQSELVSSLVKQSQTQVSDDTVRKQLELLLELAPEWCSIKRVGRFQAFHCKINVNLADVQKRVLASS